MRSFNRCTLSLTRGLGLACTMTALLVSTGCSSGDNKPLSSANSPFSDSGSNNNETGLNTNGESASASGKAIEVPSGNATELVEFVKRMFQQKPDRQQGMVMADAILEATGRILDDGQATDEQRRFAAESKLHVLVQLGQTNAPGIQQKVINLGKQLSVDSDKVLAQQGKLILFEFTLQSIMSGENKDYDSFKANAMQWLEEGDDSAATFRVIYRTADTLQQLDLAEDASEIFQKLGTKFKDSSDENLAKEALNILQLAEVFQANLDIKMQDMVLKGVSAFGPIKESVTSLLAMENPGGVLFNRVRQVAEFLEQSNFTEQAMEIYIALESAYKDNPDENIREVVYYNITRSIVRLKLIGGKVDVQGIVTSDGSPINWPDYQDKVVLLTFWAAWNFNSVQEMWLTDLLEKYQQYHGDGFEVIGVNLDEKPKLYDEFIKEGIQETLHIDEFPWITLRTADPDQVGFDTPLAVTCGISSLPSTVLIGRDGRVLATNIGGPALKTLLGKHAGNAGDETPSESEDAPADETPAGSEDAPASGDSSSLDGNRLFTSLAMLKTIAFPSFFSATMLLVDEDEEQAEDNPYLASPGLSTLELIDYLLDMQEKPRSIRHRKGFAEAVSEAAERVLAAEAADRYHLIAVESKIQILHEVASLGNDNADALLVRFAEAMKDDDRPKIAAWIRFLQIERAMLEIDQLPLDQVPGKLDAMQEYLAAEKLGGLHLRLASATVHGINRLEDAEQKENYFQVFGKLFGTSTDKTLVAYGRKIAKVPSTSASQLVGKPLELDGETELGVELDWKSYRGKVVLVDFWATWCGPCLREMPNVRALHKRLKKQGFTVLAVNLDRNQEDLAKFLEENNLPWTNLVDKGAQQAATRYGVRAIPTMMVIDQQGKIVAVSHRVADVTGTIEKLLKKPAEE